jgi:F0F1-type ATP synthase membrane subunit c/vacuolar-type H+-ATPase subunit K
MNKTGAKRVVTWITAAMAAAVGIYLLLTYVVPIEPVVAPERVETLGRLARFAAIAAAIVGVIAERSLLNAARGAGQVQTAVVISAAFGEAVAIFGLLFFFLTGERLWIPFILAALYFFRLFLHLPEFHGAIERPEGDGDHERDV